MKTYIIKANKFYKIGRAENVYKRIVNIQVGCPYNIEVIAICDNDVEKRCHLDLSDYHLRGEWYTAPFYKIENLIEFYDFKKIVKYGNISSIRKIIDSNRDEWARNKSVLELLSENQTEKNTLKDI